MDEKRLEQVLGQNLAQGTEEFRDALLDRCLQVLGSDDQVVDLDDVSLEALAAAGDASLASSLAETEALYWRSLIDDGAEN